MRSYFLSVLTKLSYLPEHFPADTYRLKSPVHCHPLLLSLSGNHRKPPHEEFLHLYRLRYLLRENTFSIHLDDNPVTNLKETVKESFSSSSEVTSVEVSVTVSVTISSVSVPLRKSQRRIPLCPVFVLSSLSSEVLFPAHPPFPLQISAFRFRDFCLFHHCRMKLQGSLPLFFHLHRMPEALETSVADSTSAAH